jgi:hypothetical protein
MPFTSALPTQPSAGQVLKVTAVKSRSGNTRVRLDSGRDDADNTFYQVEIYACYLSQIYTNRLLDRAGTIPFATLASAMGAAIS